MKPRKVSVERYLEALGADPRFAVAPGSGGAEFVVTHSGERVGIARVSSSAGGPTISVDSERGVVLRSRMEMESLTDAIVGLLVHHRSIEGKASTLETECQWFLARHPSIWYTPGPCSDLEQGDNVLFDGAAEIHNSGKVFFISVQRTRVEVSAPSSDFRFEMEHEGDFLTVVNALRAAIGYAHNILTTKRPRVAGSKKGPTS